MVEYLYSRTHSRVSSVTGLTLKLILKAKM